MTRKKNPFMCLVDMAQNLGKKHFLFAMRSTKETGFSLVELMVVIGVISIVSAVATPVFLGWLPNYRLKGAARDVYSTLQSARLQAVRQNTTVRVVFNNAVNPGFYFIDLDNSGAQDQVGETRTNLMGYGSGVDFGFPAGLVDWNSTPVVNAVGFPGGPPAFCTYNSDGTSSSGTVYLVNSQRHLVYAVTTVASGAVKIRKYNGILPYNQNNWIE